MLFQPADSLNVTSFLVLSSDFRDKRKALCVCVRVLSTVREYIKGKRNIIGCIFFFVRVAVGTPTVLHSKEKRESLVFQEFGLVTTIRTHHAVSQSHEYTQC